jgi:hypothetical protein
MQMSRRAMIAGSAVVLSAPVPAADACAGQRAGCLTRVARV